jgi:hypothetical protein
MKQRSVDGEGEGGTMVPYLLEAVVEWSCSFVGCAVVRGIEPTLERVPLLVIL